MFFLEVKKDDLTPGQTDREGTHPPPKHVFGCIERKSTLLRVSCERVEVTNKTRICAAEMAVRYAALSACQKVHVCHCNSLGGAT